MKSTCLFYLGLLLGLTVFYGYHLSGTELGTMWWIGFLLALAVAGFIGNLHGLYFAIRQKISAKKPVSQWRDGDFIVVGGRVQATRPLIAPFSGREAVIVEYDVQRTISKGDSKVSRSDFSGMLMTPCTVQTRRGAVKLVGFPLLATTLPDRLEEESHFRNAAHYLAGANFEAKGSNPLKIIKQLNEALKDDDGDVNVNTKDDDAFSLVPEQTEEFKETIHDTQSLMQLPSQDRTAEEQHIYEQLTTRGYWLEETIIPQGAEVSVFGTYRANRQAIDIGSGMQNLQHAIRLGELNQVIAKNFRNAFIGTVIFAAITFYSHLYVADRIKMELPPWAEKAIFWERDQSGRSSSDS